MGVVYAVVNQKGGVGKTTTAVNAAACIAAAGKRVLLVDLDPQGNATSGLGVDKSALGGEGSAWSGSAYEVLIDGTPASDVTAETGVPGLWLLPANLDLAGAEIELMPRLARESVLRSALTEAREQFDYVFIDAPPALGLLTVNGLVAADAAIVPIQCEYYALEGVSQLMKTVDLVRRHLNPGLEIALVVLTMFDRRMRLNNQVVDEVRRVFGDRVARRVIPRNVRIAEAPSHGQPVSLYDPRSQGAAAYRDIAQEILQHGEARTG